MSAREVLEYEELPSTINTRESYVTCNIVLVTIILVVFAVVIAKIFF
jgi:hypothetical protein